MTQQPYVPQQFPQQPYPPQQPQAYPPQAPYQAPPQQYAPPMQQPGYPQQQGYPQQGPPQAPTVPLAEGSLDAFYNQPAQGGGPSLSWSYQGNQKPLNTTYVGVVAADINSTHVRQETDQQTKQPKFYGDGRPRFVMLVPLERVQGNFQTPTGQPEYPDGEATWWVKGQGRDELTRAMAEAGCTGAPKKGAVIQITLINRKPGRQASMSPSNVVQVHYTPAGTEQKLEGAAPAVAQPAQQMQAQGVAQLTQAPAPQPVVQQHTPQGAQQLAPQGYAQQAYQAAAPQQPQVAQPDPQQGNMPTHPAYAPQVQQQQAAAPGPVPPASMTPEAANILANLGVQPQQG